MTILHPGLEGIQRMTYRTLDKTGDGSIKKRRRGGGGGGRGRHFFFYGGEEIYFKAVGRERVQEEVVGS
jgi:hypothetical protein